MSRICSICEKSTMAGNRVSHSNRKTPRTWHANVHKVKIMDEKGAAVSEYVCAKCLKSGKVKRAN